MELLNRLFNKEIDETISEVKKAELKEAFTTLCANISLPGINNIDGTLTLIDGYTNDAKPVFVTKAWMNLRVHTTKGAGQLFVSRARLGHSYYEPETQSRRELENTFRTTSIYQQLQEILHKFAREHNLTIDDELGPDFIYQPRGEEPHPETPTPIYRDVVGFTISLSGKIKK